RSERGIGARDEIGARGPRSPHVVVNAGPGLGREAHVLGHTETGKKVGELKRAAEPKPGALRGAQAGDVLAANQDGALRGGQLARHQVEIGGLAGAVLPDDGGELARKESARDAVDRDM